MDGLDGFIDKSMEKMGHRIYTENKRNLKLKGEISMSSLSNFEQRLLKKYGFNSKDIRFLTTYATDDELNKLLKRLKRVNAEESIRERQRMYEARMANDAKYRHETQCKCIVGAEIITAIIANKELGISSYDQVMKSSSNNELTDEMKAIIYQVVEYIKRLSWEGSY